MANERDEDNFDVQLDENGLISFLLYCNSERIRLTQEQAARLAAHIQFRLELDAWDYGVGYLERLESERSKTS